MMAHSLCLMLPIGLLSPLNPLARSTPLRACASDSPSSWHVAVPRTLESTASQAARSCLNALRAGRGRVWVEVAAPEFDPGSPHYRQLRLAALATQLALPLLNDAELLPASRRRVKLIYACPADAAIASRASFVADLTATMLGSATAVEPTDGAFVLVAPSLQHGPAAERAVADVVAAAGSRPVVVLNPRLGNSATLAEFERGYLCRPLAVSYREDTYAETPTNGAGCLLRCYPHDWSVHVQEGDAGAGGGWKYAGSYPSQPTPAQIEQSIVNGLTRARFSSPPS